MAQERKNGNSDKSMTAVEWLVRKVNMSRALDSIPAELVIKAKQMEKEQHQETFKQSRQAKIFEDGMPPVWESFEQYYNETYGKE